MFTGWNALYPNKGHMQFKFPVPWQAMFGKEKTVLK